MILKNLVGRIQKGGGSDLKDHPLNTRFMPHKSASFQYENPNPFPNKRRSKSVVINDGKSPLGRQMTFGQRRKSNFDDFHMMTAKQANKPGKTSTTTTTMAVPEYDDEDDDASYLSLSTRSSTASDSVTECDTAPPVEEKEVPRISYTPLPEEEEYYSFLFTIADVSRNGHLIHQNEAHNFFSLSHLPPEKLSIILGMAQSANSLKDVYNKKKFNVVVRLIQLHQNKAAIKSLDLKVEDESLLRQVWFEGVVMSKKENVELASVSEDYNSYYDPQSFYTARDSGTCYTAPPKISLSSAKADDEDDDDDDDLLVAFPSLEKRMSCRSLGANALQTTTTTPNEVVSFDEQQPPTEVGELTDSNHALSLGDGNSSSADGKSHACGGGIEKCKSCVMLEDRCGKLEEEVRQMKELMKVLTQDLQGLKERRFTADDKEWNDDGNSCENQIDGIIPQDAIESKETGNMEKDDDESSYEGEIIPLDVIEEGDCETQIDSVIIPQDDLKLQDADTAVDTLETTRTNDERPRETPMDGIIPQDEHELIDNKGAMVLVPTLACMYEYVESSDDDDYDDGTTEDRRKLVNDAIDMAADATIIENIPVKKFNMYFYY